MSEKISNEIISEIIVEARKLTELREKIRNTYDSQYVENSQVAKQYFMQSHYVADLMQELLTRRTMFEKLPNFRGYND
jgi:hypothetical protein